jgi:hypothetical protein
VRLPTNKSDLLGTTIQVRRTGITVCLVFATRPSLMIGSRLKKTRSLVRWKRTTAPPPGDGAAFWVGFMRGPSSGLCLRELFASDGGAGLGTETDGGRIGAAGPNGLAGNSNAFMDN